MDVIKESKSLGSNRKRGFEAAINESLGEEYGDGLGDFVGVKSRNFGNVFSSRNVCKKDMKLGTLLYGVIDDVNEKELTISLPGLNKAIISAGNTLEDEDSLDEFARSIQKLGLNERFTVGQPVNCAVISNNKIKNNLTIRPSILNAGLNNNSKCFDVPGYVISGMLVSKENHGYGIYTGIKGIKSAFMKFGKGVDNYRLGQILVLNVNKYYKERSLLVCTPMGNNNEESDNGKTIIKRNEMLSIYEIKPGLKLECLIHSYGDGEDKSLASKNGGKNGVSMSNLNKKRKLSKDNVKKFQPNAKMLQLKNIDKNYVSEEEILGIKEYLQEENHSLKVSFCMGTMLGVVPSEHSVHPLFCLNEEYRNGLSGGFKKRFPCSSVVIARIIAVISDSNNKIVLSILPHVVGNEFKVGNDDLVNKIVVPILSKEKDCELGSDLRAGDKVNSLSNITLYGCGNDVNEDKSKGINFLSNIGNKWFSMCTYLPSKDSEKIDQTIRTCQYRIVSYSRLENSYLVSFDSKIVNERYFSAYDISPGKIVDAKVVEINNWGLSVRLSDYFSGRVYVEHLFNSSMKIQTGASGNKSMNKEQMNYIKKNYQIGREYKFRILRYEYSDNSWNQLLLLTAKKALIRDKLPIIASISSELKVGQIATGYISRICLVDGKQESSIKSSGSYIIVRFYGEAYGSVSYREYVNYLKESELNLEKEDISSIVPKIGDVVTVRIRSIDLNGFGNSRSLKLSLDIEKDKEDNTSLSSSVRSLINQLRLTDNTGYFNDLTMPDDDERNLINVYDLVLLGVTVEKGFVFIRGRRELLYLTRSSISDNKKNSGQIFDMLYKLCKTSRSLGVLNKKIKKVNFGPNLNVDCSRTYKQRINLIRFDSNNEEEERDDSRSIELSLTFRSINLMHSSTYSSNKRLDKGSLCWGNVTHIDKYGLLVSVRGLVTDGSVNIQETSKDCCITGLVPKHLLSSNIYFDSKEELYKHFEIGESLILRVVDISEGVECGSGVDKRVILSCRDIFSVLKWSGASLEGECEVVNQIFASERRDVDLINRLAKAIGVRSTKGVRTEMIGKIMGFKIKKRIFMSGGNELGVLASVDMENSSEEVYLRLLNNETALGKLGNLSDEDFKSKDALFGLVLGGGYVMSIDGIGDTTYVYNLICINDDVKDKYEKTGNFLRMCREEGVHISNSLLSNIKTRSYRIIKNNIVYLGGLYCISLLDVDLDLRDVAVNKKAKKLAGQLKTIPVVVYSNRFDKEYDVGEFECFPFEVNFEDVPICYSRVLGVRSDSSLDKRGVKTPSLGVDDVVECKIIDHMNMYNGLIVQLRDKSFGRIHVLELDDDNLDRPLSIEKYKIGNTIKGIIYGRSDVNRKVLLSESCCNPRLKYANLSWEISSRVSRVRKIIYKKDDGNLIGVISAVSEISRGSILSGYISNSGREGVFVRYGLGNLVGRIKLRELTLRTITPEEARSTFYPGRYIKQMIVTNIGDDNRVDLSLSKLQSDDIKLRISQLEEEALTDGIKMEVDQEEIAGGGDSGDKNNNLILSDVNRKLGFDDLYVGRVLGGVVKNVSKKHGLFIRLTDLKGDVVALSQIQECLDAECSGNTISSVFSVGDNVLCKVIKLDTDNEKVWVGVKPSYFEKYRVDQDEECCGKRERELELTDASNEREDEDCANYANDIEKSHSLGFSINESSFVYPREVGSSTGSNDNMGSGSNSDPESDSGYKDSETYMKQEKNNSGKPDLETKNLNRNKKVQKQLEREHKLRQEEERGMYSHLNPTNIDEFERTLVTNRDVSSIWIKYMSYYLDTGDLDKARAIAERSLRQISVKEEIERWNMWIAYINMEIVYGGVSENTKNENAKAKMRENLSGVIERALMNVYDQKRLYIQIFNSFKKYSTEELGLSILLQGLKKYPSSRKLWVTYLTSLYENDNQRKTRDDVIQKSLKSVSKHKLVRFITDIARLEFEHGNVNRGRTIFENLLDENIKRMDLWSQYFDILTKLCVNNPNSEYIEMVRSIYRSSSSNGRFKPRGMKMIFTRWLTFEKQFGNSTSQKNVQELAINYVTNLESKL
ncbi:RRP5-like protein [Cryptosporidium ryanae]|uniref:RRP5-like protein n=1 Tax=Cryptosporidium ryanae TaxID=515981 RepID=UPI00351A2632|nr:RRP5-like protein [Cryptosporidium ryanae]